MAAPVACAAASSSLALARQRPCWRRRASPTMSRRSREALDDGGLPAGRKAVSMIVGRDPESLDEAGVCRAAIESLAENFSDGVVAPAFWLAVGGLAGGAGLQGGQHRRLHDRSPHAAPRGVRLGGGAFRRSGQPAGVAADRAASGRCRGASCPARTRAAAWRAVWRDAGKHRSPNAGWPEAAMAGALGLALAGPRVYGGVDGRRRLHGRRRTARGDRRRHPARAAALLGGGRAADRASAVGGCMLGADRRPCTL